MTDKVNLREALPTGTTFEQLGLGVGALTTLINGGYSQKQITSAIQYVIENLLIKELELDPLLDVVIFEGDSITAGSNGASHVLYDTYFSDGVGLLPPNYNNAVGGQTASQMVEQIEDINALNPKVVVFMAGINDLQGTSDTADVIFNNIQTCVNGYISGGADRVIILKILPSSVLSETKESYRIQINESIDGLASENVIVVSAEDVYDYSTMTVDNLHPDSNGAVVIGKIIAAALKQLFSNDDILSRTLTDNNIIYATSSNAELAGSSGSKSGHNLSGEVATGWVAEQSGGAGITAVCTKEDNQDGTFTQVVHITGTPSAGGDIFRLRKNVYHDKLIGEGYTLFAKMEIVDGHRGISSIYAGCGNGTTVSSTIRTEITEQGLTGVIRSPVASLLTADSNYSYSQIGVVFSGGEIDAVVRISYVNLVKVI
jgi:lysophospholipase L1-like esterase